MKSTDTRGCECLDYSCLSMAGKVTRTLTHAEAIDCVFNRKSINSGCFVIEISKDDANNRCLTLQNGKYTMLYRAPILVEKSEEFDLLNPAEISWTPGISELRYWDRFVLWFRKVSGIAYFARKKHIRKMIREGKL